MRRKLFLLLAVIALPFLFYWATWMLFPLQASEWSTRWTFWREGVTEVESAGLHGFLRDTCSTAKKEDLEAHGCACVAMVHGLADNATTWKHVLIWPSNGWTSPMRLFAFDLPGSGRSLPPADLSEYGVRAQARKLKSALAPLCSQWIVVGNSLGGWVASWLALDWPEGVRRLVLADSAGLRDEVSEADARAFFVNPTVESLKEFQRRAYYQGRPLPDSVWRAVVDHMASSNARQVLEAQKPEDFLDDRLPSLRKPTMLLWGAADRITPVDAGKRFKALIPSSIWQEAPACGHLPQKECPLEVIRSIVHMLEYGSV